MRSTDGVPGDTVVATSPRTDSPDPRNYRPDLHRRPQHNVSVTVRHGRSHLISAQTKRPHLRYDADSSDALKNHTRRARQRGALRGGDSARPRGDRRDVARMIADRVAARDWKPSPPAPSGTY